MDKRVTLVLLMVAMMVAALVGFPRAAAAHTMGLSTGRYEARDARVDVEIALARAELLGSCAAVDLDLDRTISPAELAKRPDCLGLAEGLVVMADGARCAPSKVDAALTEADGALLRLSFTCPARPVRFEIDLRWLAKLPASHKHVARAKGREERDLLLDPTNTRFEIEPPEPSADGAGTRASTGAAQPNLFTLGITHILGASGLDHLAFLLGLVLVPAAWSKASARALFFAITAFSVGHTSSLALAMSGVFVPDARFVEPLIAISIAWVGAENAFASAVRRRTWVTLPFGFVHGFGFAASLREVMGSGVALPLFTFNLGVEVGQVAAVLPMVALTLGLTHVGLLGHSVRRALNIALLVGGVVLAITRVLS